MQPQKLYLLIFAGISAIIVSVFGFVYNSTRNPQPGWEVKKAYSFRGNLFYVLASLIIILLLFTFSMFPYAKAKEVPEVVVPVEAQQFQFTVRSPDEIHDANGASTPVLPLNKLIEFRVTSKDVNHGFAIYSPEGDIISQVQAMPGYVNRLRVKFTQPGIYQILCLEYCGMAHHIMKAEIQIR